MLLLRSRTCDADLNEDIQQNKIPKRILSRHRTFVAGGRELQIGRNPHSAPVGALFVSMLKECAANSMDKIYFFGDSPVRVTRHLREVHPRRGEVE